MTEDFTIHCTVEHPPGPAAPLHPTPADMIEEAARP